MKSRILSGVIGFVLAAVLFGLRVHAQATGLPIVSYVAGSHTTCAVTVGATTFCFASGDGLWVSLNGGAFTQSSAAAGVSSLTVCNAAGLSCGVAQAGAVTLKIPSTATTTSSTALQ